MNLYTVSTDYIDFLRKFQINVWMNEENYRLRPYVGVVMKLDRCEYFAPLSSPKPKHSHMKDRLDFIRLEHRGQLKGVVNLNNMIPVTADVSSPLEINSVADEGYRHLLNVEMIDIRRKSGIIAKNALIVYRIVTKFGHEPQNAKLVAICYDFLMLESKLDEYLRANHAVKQQ